MHLDFDVKQVSMQNLCPLCGKDDRVQKVSAIVSSGTLTTSYEVPVRVDLGGNDFYASVPRQGSSQTALARQLAFPSDSVFKNIKDTYIAEAKKEIPNKFPPPKYNFGAVLYISRTLLTLPIVIYGAYGAIIGNLKIAGLSLLFLVGLWGLVYLVGFLVRPQYYKKWLDKYNLEIAKADYDAGRMDLKAFDRWDRMYYCSRDDVLFIPGEARTASPIDMLNFLLNKF
jgi:hypothetical protein